LPPPLPPRTTTTKPPTTTTTTKLTLGDVDNNDDDDDDDEETTTTTTPLESSRRRRFPPPRILYTSAITVPPYSLWVEGDNWYNSQDSRHSQQQQQQQQQSSSSLWSSNHPTSGHGPVSKKLLVGVAEYIVWPLSRIGPIRHEYNAKKQYPHLDPYYFPSPRSYWP
jgi:hypothetical protein